MEFLLFFFFFVILMFSLKFTNIQIRLLALQDKGAISKLLDETRFSDVG